MAVRSTSIKAYKGIENTLGGRPREVYDILPERWNWTNAEIAEKMGLPINQVTPRIFELRKMGLVGEDGRRQCRATGHTAYAWRINKK